MKRLLINLFLSFFICLGLAQLAPAAEYPERTVEVIVTYAPGGTTDTLARITSPPASKMLGQPFVVINKPGAGGAIAYDAVAKSKPDGYTLVIYAINAVILKAIQPEVNFHPIDDFAPISLFATQANILVVPPKSKITSLAQFVEEAKKNPGKIAFGSSGVGGSPHLSGELLKSMAKIDITHVPYKGHGPQLPATIGGHIDSGFFNAGAGVEHVRSGSIRALAVTTAQRIPELPNVPTIAESGYPGYEVVSWIGIGAPKKTPAAIVEKLGQVYRQIMQDPEHTNKMTALGFVPRYMSPEEFLAYAKSELEKFSKLAKEANIKMK